MKISMYKGKKRSSINSLLPNLPNNADQYVPLLNNYNATIFNNQQ